MTDTTLALALNEVTALEQAARDHWEHSQADAMEREQALAVIRLVIPLRRTLAEYIAARACRVVLQQGV